MNTAPQRLRVGLLLASCLWSPTDGRGAPARTGMAPPAPEGTNFWAFQPLRRIEPPAAATLKASPHAGRWTEIDRFVLARLAEAGLTLQPPDDQATLLRRATFDLHGLPPTPAELDAFLADRSADAFARVVDRLLDSPRYGERWARHWLDLARFSESDGFEFDKIREHAWPYRDYLVRSFNADTPYARFVTEQLAGDVTVPVTRDSIAATGFLTAGPFDEAGNTSASALLKACLREEEMEDMVAAVSLTFLGLTVNCARCHDHKFDPIPQTDYYRLKATFDGVRHGNRPWQTPAEAHAQMQEVTRLREASRQHELQLAAREQAGRETALQQRQSRRPAPGPPDVPTPRLPSPIARWSFDNDARDSLGGLHGTLLDGAEIAGGRLRLRSQGAFVRTEPLARRLREKTIEAWVTLADLSQRGGGVISVETKDSGTFDAIVFGERVSRRWQAGSSAFQRTRDLTAPEEAAPPGKLVHIAIVYAADHSIRVYREGGSIRGALHALGCELPAPHLSGGRSAGVVWPAAYGGGQRLPRRRNRGSPPPRPRAHTGGGDRFRTGGRRGGGDGGGHRGGFDTGATTGAQRAAICSRQTPRGGEIRRRAAGTGGCLAAAGSDIRAAARRRGETPGCGDRRRPVRACGGGT